MTHSPPRQTPATFLDGFGAELFSAECVNAIQSVGWKPGWFGSYDHVRKQIEAAQKRVKEGSTDPADTYLAGCQAHHVSQDATHVEQGGRNNPCKHLEDGYATNVAPCMPLSGSAWNPPGGGHNVASRDEVACAMQARVDAGLPAVDPNPPPRKAGKFDPNAPPPPPPVRYDPARREQDELNRLKLVVNNQGPNDQRPELVPKSGTPGGGASSGTSGDGSKVNEDDLAKPSTPAEQAAIKEKAAECINHFKKEAMKEMRSRVSKKRIADAQSNHAIADGPAKGTTSPTGAAYRKKLEDEARAAREGASNAAKDRNRKAHAIGGCTKGRNARARELAAATTEAQEADQKLQNALANPASTQNADIAALTAEKKSKDAALAKATQDAKEAEQKLVDAKNDLAAAQQAEKEANRTAGRAVGRSSRVQRAQCEAEEGDRLAALQAKGGLDEGCANGMPRSDKPVDARVQTVPSGTVDNFNRTGGNPNGEKDTEV